MRRPNSPRPLVSNAARRGFTLLEVLLSLVLAGVVLLALTTAIYTHMFVIDKGRTRVEEAQLARTLLHRIANDIRGAIRYDPLDISKLVPDLTPESLQSLADDSGLEGMDLSEVEEEEDSAQAPSESAAPQLVPGLYGNRYELQVDVSRLPRIDQFQRALVAAGPNVVDRVSDVKTVAYYVIYPQTGALATAPGAAGRHGLVRRELDRAVTSWAADTGDLADMNLQLEPIAPEVFAIEFLYFDGQQWVDQWDSDEMGGLPVAVQIGIALEPPSQRGLPDDQALAAQQDATGSYAQPVFYRLLVHLPASAPTTGEDASGESEEESDEDSEEGDEEGSDGESTDDDSGGLPSDMTAIGSSGSTDSTGNPAADAPADLPFDPGSVGPDAGGGRAFNPKMFQGTPFNPEALRGQSFDPEALRGQSFNPEALRGLPVNPQMLRNLRSGGGSFPGRSFGGGGSGAGGGFGGRFGGGSSGAGGKR